MYNLRILDINRRRIAVIDRLESWRYTRRPSEATEISVTLPREDVEAALPAGVDVYAFLAPYQVVPVGRGSSSGPDEGTHRHARIAHYVEIYRGTKHVVTGRISKRDIKDDTITIQCHTEEIELESHVTPAQYGRKWDHWDLADVARDMLRGWHVQRVKDKTQWDAAIERVNVDTSTEPGVVMLAKSGGKYVSQGHITLRFSKADVPGFHSWDRIRWASDNVAPVRTTMQWRADGGPWSQEMEGALPDEVGVVPGSANADVIDVRINLYTEDQEAEDANGNPVGVTPYVFAVEMIARTERRIEAGDIPAAAGVLVSGLEADGASALNVLSQACEQAGWEFWVSDGKLNLAKQMGEDRTASVLLRAGTNMTVQTLSEGDDELVNVITAYGPGEGINRLQVTRRHEESIAKYGEYRGVQTFEGATDLASLIDAADEYLAEHAAPVPAFRVEAQYPYGEEPEFGCGDYVRVADPRNGIITRSRIAEEQRSYSTSGLKTTLYLGLPAPNLARTVRPTPPPRPVQPPDKPVISVSPIPGGIRVVDTKAPNIRWSTSEVHMSTAKGFVPSAETLVADGRRVRFDIGGLTPDVRYYVRVIRFDTDGVPSEPSDEMSAVAGDIPEPTPDLTPPTKPTGLAAIPILRGFVLTWDRHQTPPPLDRYVLQVSSRPEGGNWSAWSTVSDEIRSNYYSHEGLEPDREYRYRLRAISRAQVESDWSSIGVAGKPGRVSLAEDVVGRLARGNLAEDVVAELDGIVTIESNLDALSDDVGELSGQVSAVVQTADELSQTVAQVEDGLTTAQSAIQQNADQIALRLVAVDENGDPVPSAQIVIAQVDGQGRILLDASKVIVPGSIIADDIQGGTLVLTGDMAIENPEGTLRMTGKGIEMTGPDGETTWSPEGLSFINAYGRQTGFVRGVLSGIAKHGDTVPLPFVNTPTIILQPLDMLSYDPAYGNQRLRMQVQPVEQGPDGFRVSAQTVIEGEAAIDHTFGTRTYRPSGTSRRCLAGQGHTDDGDPLSDESLFANGSSVTYTTTSSNATRIEVQLREMMHAHAFAGSYHARNTLTYRVMVRRAGSSSWLRTMGPYTRSIEAISSLLSARFSSRHDQRTFVFDDLPPDQYEVRVEITNKTVRPNEGANSLTDSCFLIIDRWVESGRGLAIDDPDARVQWIAFESSNVVDT